MKRLHSRLTYPFAVLPLVFDGYITFMLLNEIGVSYKSIFIALLINLIFLTRFYFIVKDFKRIYVSETEIYVYDLYSRIPYVFPREDLRDVERDNSRYTVLWGIYKIIFAIDDHLYYDATFIKSKAISNLREYIYANRVD